MATSYEDSYEERQEDEVEFLQAVFPGDFQDLRHQDAWKVRGVCRGRGRPLVIFSSVRFWCPWLCKAPRLDRQLYMYFHMDRFPIRCPPALQPRSCCVFSVVSRARLFNRGTRLVLL